MTYVLGLTGSIGMGKSTTAGFFREEGIPVWDADEAVHCLYEKGGEAAPKIAAVWPKAVHEGQVDRADLKRWIAEEPDALKILEEIVHPLVAKDRAAFLESHKSAGLVVLDIPLLFETGGNAKMDGVLVVSVHADIQRARVLERDTMSPEMFENILARQMPDAEKRKRADFVIETQELEQTRADVKTLIAKLTGEPHA